MSEKRYEEMAPEDEAPPDEPAAGAEPCPECEGTGRRDGGRCEACAGTGQVERAVGGG